MSQTKSILKYPRNTVLITRGIQELKKIMCTGSLLGKKSAKECHVLTTEKLDEIGARLKHTPQKSLRCLAQKTGLTKASAATAIKLLKLKPYKMTVVHALNHVIHLTSLKNKVYRTNTHTEEE
jgi:hypothetical protein